MPPRPDQETLIYRDIETVLDRWRIAGASEAAIVAAIARAARGSAAMMALSKKWSDQRGQL